jgi:hypothetical protein
MNADDAQLIAIYDEFAASSRLATSCAFENRRFRPQVGGLGLRLIHGFQRLIFRLRRRRMAQCSMRQG